MSTNTGGPAFPCDRIPTPDGRVITSDGMTLRDYFAARASDEDIKPYWVAPLNREQAKYKYADAMLKARNA